MADLRRRPPPAWTQPLLQRLTPTVRALIIAVTLAYFFFVLVPPLDDWIVAHLFVGPGLFRGELWQPVTALFIHARFMGWIFSIIGLWWVGAFVERVRGRRFFLRLFVGAGVAANVVAALVARLTSATGGEVRSDGAGFALTAVFVAFARIYGAQPAQIWGAFSMRADYFTWLLIGFSALVSLANRDWPGLAAELTAVAVALGATGGFSELARRGAAGKRARYRVLDGGKKRPTTLN